MTDYEVVKLGTGINIVLLIAFYYLDGENPTSRTFLKAFIYFLLVVELLMWMALPSS